MIANLILFFCLVAVFGFGWAGGVTTARSTCRHIRAQNSALDAALRAEQVASADALTAAENRRDRAEAAYQALILTRRGDTGRADR